MKREPLLTRSVITAAATALVGMLVAFHVWHLSGDQRSAVLGCIGVVAPLVVAFLTRGKVTPVADPRLPLPPRANGGHVGPRRPYDNGGQIKPGATSPRSDLGMATWAAIAAGIIVGGVVLWVLSVLVGHAG